LAGCARVGGRLPLGGVSRMPSSGLRRGPRRGAVIVVVVMGSVSLVNAGADARVSTSSRAYKLSALMTPAAGVPKPVQSASRRGAFSGTLTLDGTTATVAWRLRLGRLSSRVIAAELRSASRGRQSRLVRRLCTSCRPDTKGSFELTRVRTKLVRAMLD